MEDADDSKYTDVDAPPDEEPTGRDTRLGPGTEVGGYIIDGELGHGGMGVVYSATHPVIGKRAAIKVLRPELSKQPIAVERFIREARAVNQIGHPNIVDIFAFDKLPDGRAYLVMDLLVGESLRKRLRRGPCHFSEAASIIDEMASALIAAHDKGFIHRDLKPDNVFLVARDGRWPEVKILDFGLTKLVSDKGQRPFQTKTGVLLGTPDYMSPEQARGHEIDYRTDIYALGVIMFEILTGRRPFPKGATPFETLQAHVQHPVPSLGEACPALPQEMAQLGEAMLAKNPEGRPSLAAVRTVFKRLRSNTLIPTMSVASLEMSVPSGQTKPPEPLGLTASRVGAEPIVPSATGLAPQPIAQETAPAVATRPPTASGAKWPSTVPGTVPSVDPRRDPTRTSGAHPPVASNPSLRPPSNPQASNPGLQPSNPQPSNPAIAAQPIAATSGLRAKTTTAETKFGVPPPPVRVPDYLRRPSTPPVNEPVPKRSGRAWIIIGAVVAIAAGIAIALAVV